MTSLRELLVYLKPYRNKIALILLAMAGAALMTGAYALLVKNIVDDFLINNRPGVFTSLILAIVAVSAIAGLCLYGQNYLSSYVGQRIILDLRRELYQHIITLSPAYFSGTSTSKTLSRIINDVEVVQHILRTAASTLAKEGWTVLVLLGVLFYRDWSLALISLFIFPVIALLVHHFGSKLRTLSKLRLEQLGKVTDRLSESLRNLRLVQAFGRESFEAERFAAENQNLFQRMMKIAKLNAVSGPALDFIRGFGIALVIGIGSYQIKSKTISYGEFLSFATALGLLYMPLKRIVYLFNSLNEGLGAVSRVFEVLHSPPAISDTVQARPLQPMKKTVEFEGVSFAYDTRWALDHVHFSIEAGEVVALVGPSGAGKSTLMQLLLRFYDPKEGRICLDGQDIRFSTLASLRSQISWVSQENMLFNDTIRANIAYSNLHATDEEIWQAAHAARAADFIEKTSLGLDTPVGEGGQALSGGERQRIAIARAFLKKAPILILDEATSSVDTPTEHLIQEAIRELVKDRTTLDCPSPQHHFLGY
jgi:subfamily B ATP-binding cassette protein MsbA